ncbi:hypothetical protein NUU61_000446 [Penicillium alfredii]|uniref:Exosome complex protein n=1 Tax=Penicillium alfredii TaxID=1506179 RepID=A0A9W9G9Y0_9EURO|nr:uncharacterized protein NUU61_000446 [Penicillium alfredii]KAJ5114687.1 hypothetical protein NUU61_000446 [Penicillium alfredii]
MDTETLLPLLEQLDDHVDDLEEVLQPFLGHSLSKSSKNLPLMDKAKLHVLITYTLESLIFSYLRLHGTDAKQHPVFRELTRVRQYFEKIKALETEPEQRPMTLDKEAAGRFIKHGLVGTPRKLTLTTATELNNRRERKRAEIRAAMLAKKSAAASQGHPTPAQNVSSAGVSDDDADSDEEVSRDPKSYSQDDSAQPQKPEKKEKNKAKEEKTKARSKDAKAAKKQRKHDKSGRKEEKKERRKKKEETRKARKAN